jgi:hypothetical protein
MSVVDEVREWLHNLNHVKNWQAIGTIKSRAHAEGQEQALYHQLRDEGERWLQALQQELAEERGETPNPEWERIEKLSDDEVKAELIADGMYKDEADIAEHAAKFTLRVHEMLRMKKAGERIGRKKLADEILATDEAVLLDKLKAESSS